MYKTEWLGSGMETQGTDHSGMGTGRSLMALLQDSAGSEETVRTNTEILLSWF